MFHPAARPSAFSDSAAATTMYEADRSYSAGVEIIHAQWGSHDKTVFHCLTSFIILYIRCIAYGGGGSALLLQP